MIDFVVLVLLIIHKLLKLFAEQMDLAKIKRTKVRKERFIYQIIVDAEVESVLTGLWRVLITDPIETSGDDLDGLISV